MTRSSSTHDGRTSSKRGERAAPRARIEMPILLVIDDDEDVRESLQILLEGEGYAVVTAHHGARAKELLLAGLEPRLILLDIMMPVMNGWEFWDLQQQHPAWQSIPTIVLTASGLSTGAIGRALVLPKPVDVDVLLEAIRGATPQ